ncbi:MAG: nucleotidyltransferase domain-containing protein [Spirochaetales bacterium]
MAKKKETINWIHSLLECFPEVGEVVLYGSRAKGNFKNGSDIDLTLIGKAGLNERVLYRIMDEIEDCRYRI